MRKQRVKHFCCIWKWDGKYFYINDPASASSSRAKGTESEVKNARKQFFIFYNGEPDTTQPDTTKDTGTPPTTDTQEPIAVTTGTEIIDISKYQGKVNWKKLAPKVAVVFIKASGLYKNGTDPQYANNVAGAVANKVPFHAYHFLYCTTEAEAKRDAALFYSSVKEQGHMPISWVLDCEGAWGVSDSKAAKIAGAFERELRAHAGQDIKVGIYVANQKYNDWDFDYEHFDFVWIPKYSSSRPTHKCDLWQYTSTGKIDGIDGNVDMNVITGDGKTLAWFRGESEDHKEAPSDEQPVVSGQKVRVVNGNVNVRTQPNTDGDIIGVAYKGDELEYGGVTAENGWFAVAYKGQSAWISGKYGQLI